MLSFAAQSTLLTGEQPERVGNGHPNIVPYGAFQASDGFIVIALGTDKQFRNFCNLVDRPELSTDPRFLCNSDRVHHRQDMLQIMNQITSQHTRDYWLKALEQAGIPCGPVNTIPEMFTDPQVEARGLAKGLSDSTLKTVASPLNLSDSPVSYKKRPPRLGEG